MVDKRSNCAGKTYAIGIYMTCKTTCISAVDMLGEHGYFDRPGDPEYIRGLRTCDYLNPGFLAHFLAVFGHHYRFLAHAFHIGFKIQYYQWFLKHAEKKKNQAEYTSSLGCTNNPV